MMPSTLAIYIRGERCGKLEEDRHGALSFTYDTDYRGIPLSLSMPVGLARYGDRVVRPYLMGLLPDDQATRAAIGRPFGVSGENPFRLLRIIGRDCPGAVQVFGGDEPSLAENAGHDLIELSEDEVAMRLAEVREDAAAAWSARRA